jgi:hypothetical protein
LIPFGWVHHDFLPYNGVRRIVIEELLDAVCGDAGEMDEHMAQNLLFHQNFMFSRKVNFADFRKAMTEMFSFCGKPFYKIGKNTHHKCFV